MAVWKDKTEISAKPSFKIELILIFLIMLALFSGYFLLGTSYEFSISGKSKGPDFELNLREGLRRVNYTATDIQGEYGVLSIDESLPPEQACISNADIIRVGGIVKYGGVSNVAKRHFSRTELDKCVLRIVSYLDRRYIPMNSNKLTY